MNKTRKDNTRQGKTMTMTMATTTIMTNYNVNDNDYENARTVQGKARP